MKRNYTYLITGFLVFWVLSSRSQSLSLSISQQTQCFSSANNSVVVTAIAGPTAATNYTWTASGSGTCAGVATFSGTGQTAIINFPCCGIYNIYCSAINNTLTPNTPVVLTSSFVTTTITCAPSVTVAGSYTASACMGSSILLYATGANSYTWQPGNFISMSINPVLTANTCYTVTGKSSAGCTSTVSQCVTLTPVPNLTVSGGSTVCAGGSLTFAVSGANTYTWVLGTQSLTGSSITMTPTASGCVSVQGMNATGCKAYSSVCVTVGNTPLTLSGPNSVCSGGTVTLTASGLQSYTWMPGNMTGSAVVVSPTSNICYTVTGSNGSGCNSMNTKCLTMTTLPNISITGQSVICTGNTIPLTAGGATSYTWIPSNNTSATINITPTASSCYTVIGAVSGCTNSAVKCVSVVPGPTLVITGNTFVCAGAPVTYTASGATSYTWSVGTQTFAGTSVTITPNAAMCFTVKSTNSTCTVSSTKCISIQPNSSVTISGPGGICTAGGSATLIASGSQSYTWMPGNLTGSMVVVTPTANTCYTITSDNGAGCIGTWNKCVNINVTPPVISVSGGSFCVGQPKTLTASGAISYTWLPSNLTGSSIVVTPLANTCYTAMGMTGVGCIVTATSCITLMSPPNVSISGPSVSCSSVAFSLTAGGATSYTWKPTNSTLTTLNITSVGNGNLCYTLVGSVSGCTNSAVKCVSIFPNSAVTPTITASSTTVCLGGTVTLSVIGGNTYTWSNGGTGPVITVMPTGNNCFSVTATNSAGCNSKASKCLTVQITTSIAVSPPSYSVCKGSSATFTASGANTYTWSTGSNNPVVNVLPQVSTVYSVSGKSTQGCIGTKTLAVTVNTACSDVWPGDANSNGIVTNIDIFELGLAFNSTGPARVPGGNVYISQFANNWAGTISSGKNKCHADCNGDGVVNLGDTLAVYNNFSLTHPFKPSGTSSADGDLSINPSLGQFIPGQWNKVDIMLGDVSNPLPSLAGVAFDFNFDQSLVEADSAYIAYTSSFLNTGNQNVQFRKNNFTNGMIYAASVRIDGADVSGNGKIAEFHFKMKSGLPDNSVINMQIQNPSTINQAGINYEITGGTSALSLGTVGIHKIKAGQNGVQMFPNPAANQLMLSSDLLVPVNYTIYDVTGRAILNGSFNGSKTLDIAAFASGTYVVRFDTGETSYHKKLTVVK